ncbi:hypothetical protein [Microvirga sp. 2TAF3]|uniref:hypothetical protein n=1 Tax=Microvirga sp. 2TAF3 TaxID=3233014 RepID=UPI003F99577E
MADIIAFEEFRKNAKQCEILALFKDKPTSKAQARKNKNKFYFPSSRPGISGNLCDLFEQANAVIVRHYDGDQRVPKAVAEKCLELLRALSEHTQPELSD